MLKDLFIILLYVPLCGVALIGAWAAFLTAIHVLRHGITIEISETEEEETRKDEKDV